jgi:hypothetical protein
MVVPKVTGQNLKSLLKKRGWGRCELFEGLSNYSLTISYPNTGVVTVRLPIATPANYRIN